MDQSDALCLQSGDEFNICNFCMDYTTLLYWCETGSDLKAAFYDYFIYWIKLCY